MFYLHRLCLRRNMNARTAGKKRGGNFHLTGGNFTLYTISTMVDSRVFELYTNLSV